MHSIIRQSPSLLHLDVFLLMTRSGLERVPTNWPVAVYVTVDVRAPSYRATMYSCMSASRTVARMAGGGGSERGGGLHALDPPPSPLDRIRVTFLLYRGGRSSFFFAGGRLNGKRLKGDDGATQRCPANVSRTWRAKKQGSIEARMKESKASPSHTLYSMAVAQQCRQGMCICCIYVHEPSHVHGGCHGAPGCPSTNDVW